MRLPVSPRTTQTMAQALLWAAGLLTLLVLIFIVGFVLKQGFPVLNAEFLMGRIQDMGKAGGIFPAIVGTFYVALVGLVIATPLGVGTAIYLTEYTQESRVTQVIRFGADCLAGVPSIIFGLFGFVFFVVTLKLGWCVLSGGLTLAFMILPTIIRTAEEAIKAVPYAYREVGFVLGGTKWQVVSRVVLPRALPGILTGVILGLGRSVGETAAVIFTAGASVRIPVSLLDSTRTMSVHFYILAREGLSMENAYGTAAVLVIAILIINLAAYHLMQRFVARYS